ncbi:hypothetical protein P152DRAFT_19164 [Eremomyces bilateralis CBS 781.70]|uniref:Pyridoxamine 5'-phosphate oxidase Alr4036 family FMN-binding domain-containing protein n=1 Tax=Eremomyces bilateralis CBS 781.70 TaxID=1392243 RepID=A0A6G1GHG8_9PEZI|nr:uncharacterized protein P152DRAFT_19164 [Eremomyces bilateralis CBS 781.70]KAF1817432.1 hypothetical protein P152DRAFT_19164 [Eremomyces bilateralis CBS 781.70]
MSFLPSAPWRDAFLSHISKMPMPTFVLSTLHRAPPGSLTEWLPRARTCVFRGMWCALPENDLNNAEKNPAAFESDCVTFTTDKRMLKYGEIFASGEAPAGEGVSGGGGPVEAVWWVEEVGFQWRVKGRAYIVGNDIDDGGLGAAKAREALQQRMGTKDEKQVAEWTWSRELTAHFGNLSPTMRGTFKRPPPGTPADKPYDDKTLQLGTKLKGLDDAVARENFQVVVIVPDEVEKLDLNDPVEGRRHNYIYQAQSGRWHMEVLWP